jgi:hypothetical protein
MSIPHKYMIIVLCTDDCLLHARDTKEIEYFVKTLRDDYKLTLNDPYPIDDFLGIIFSHKDKGELYTSQTGIIDAVTESAHIPKGGLKNTPTPATSILRRTCKARILELSLRYRTTQLSCTKFSARDIIHSSPVHRIL